MDLYRKILKFCQQNPVVVYVTAYALLAMIMIALALISTL